MRSSLCAAILFVCLAAGTARSQPATPIDEYIAQAKLSFPMGDVVRVPVSLTWSNRSELIGEADVRGQLGFTLDLDGLFQQ